jgi:EamA-like transporter family.
MLLGFAALMYLPLAEIPAFGFFSPLIVVIFSVLFLKGRIFLIRIFALCLGFAGVIILLRPGIIEVNIGSYMVLSSAFMWSSVFFLTRFMSKEDSPMTILTFQYTFVSLFTLPLAIIYWSSPSYSCLIYCVFSAITGPILHLCINNSS